MTYVTLWMVIKMKDNYLHLIKEHQILSLENYKMLEIVQFNKSECLLKQGQILNELYILVEGRVKSCHTTPNGVSILYSFSKPIAVIGEVEFLNHKEVINDIYAVEKTICFKLSVIKYKQQLLEDRLFMRYLATAISYKLYTTNQNASISMNYPVKNRLASYLICCQEKGIIEENFVQVSQMIGCSYRQLLRSIHEFCKKQYIIKTKNGQFKIINNKELKRLGEDVYFFF